MKTQKSKHVKSEKQQRERSRFKLGLSQWINETNKQLQLRNSPIKMHLDESAMISWKGLMMMYTLNSSTDC